jgi:branched-chain amino acid transport system permease protein
MRPCGVFNENYAHDKAIIHTKTQWCLLIILLLGLFSMGRILPDSLLGYLNTVGIFLISILGLQILIGYSGQLSLGHAAFIGFGAFISGAAKMKLGLPDLLCIFLGGVSASLFGLIFSLPAIRIKGFYLAITTVAAQFIFSFIFSRLPAGWFGGIGGLGVEPFQIGSITLISEKGQYYLIMTFAVIFTFLAVNISRSRLGRALIAIRENESAAEVMGINVFYYKMVAFCICGFFAGIAGSLWSFYTRYVGVEQFTFFDSIWYVGMLIVGGMGSVVGAIFGTATFIGLQQIVILYGSKLTTQIPSVTNTMLVSFLNISMGLLIIFLIIEPRGLVHRWEVFKNWYRLWPFPY